MSRRVYTDLDAELLLRLANRTDITSTQRGFFIKDAYLNIAMMFVHKEIQKFTTAEVITNGADSLTPNATNIWFPTSFKNTTDGFILKPTNQEDIEHLVTKPTAPPYKFYWYGGVFYFDSLANTAKATKIWYKRKPVDFSGGSSSELDELFDPLIIMDAARIGFETMRDYDEAEKQKQLFTAEVVHKKLPVEQAKLNDYKQGFRVRFR